MTADIAAAAEIPPPVGPIAGHRARLPVLDGWRATSILVVLASHLLPIGPKSLDMNWAVGAAGMSLFFTLSGFLIVRFLAEGMTIRAFAARRLARIVPLSWLAVTVLVLMHRPETGRIVCNYLFYENLPPIRLLTGGEHLWSLCIEMQFYALAAMLALIPRRRGLYLVPLLCLAVTALRTRDGMMISIITWYRVDEILAGGTLALIYCGWFGTRPQQWLGWFNPWLGGLLLLAASHHAGGPLQYIRPYLAAALVGRTLFNCPLVMARILQSRPMAYVAEISYALYIFHYVLMDTWLGSGDKLVRYLKRPLLFAILWLLAHLSTFRFERPITRLARRIGQRS